MLNAKDVRRRQGKGGRQVKISIFGLGYVGTVSAGCLAEEGHDVIGVDCIATKVDLINAGQSPIIEAEIGELVKEGVRAGRLRATCDVEEAISESDLSIICVGTPSQINGDLDVSFVSRVCDEIGRVIARKAKRHTIVIRSTVLPGTIRQVVIPTIQDASGKQAGDGFLLCMHPEFLREGSAVRDFRAPGKVIIGEFDQASGDVLARLYTGVEAPVIRADLETAEMIKYIDNSWHALKIGFANEIGNLCKSLSVDSQRAMEIFCMDKKLNISSAYLSPGFAFGGSCLPKDLRALGYTAKSHDLELPILKSILRSNELQIMRGLQMVIEKGHSRVGVLGFSFKAGTDDLRESPLIEVIERLLGKGYDLRIYDRNVQLAKLVGANRDFILNRIPHISKMMVDSVDEVLAHGETIVIGTEDPEFNQISARFRDGQSVVEFCRLSGSSMGKGAYDGICWGSRPVESALDSLRSVTYAID
jgi:GDP-mannose 6-dehydrogenase